MPRVGVEPIRRKALISAAIEAIHASGLGGVTMGEIARRAGVSPALAHHYFGGKDQLLLATMRHLLAELGEDIQARLARAGSGEERLSAIVRANFAGQFRPAVISAWLAFYVQAQTDPEARRLLRVYQRRLESNLLHAIKEVVGESGDAARVAAVAEIAGALIDGFWIRRSLADQPPDAEATARLIESVVLSALGRADP